MDCLISPSYSEGAGTSVMEAMMSGLFVIAYSNSGHNYVLKKTPNKLVKYNNVNNLVKNIEKFTKLNNDQIKRYKKISYKKKISKFSSNIISYKFKEILDREYKIIQKSIDVVWPFYKDRRF